MTSPVNVPTPPKKRRSSLKRQRMAVAITLVVAILLGAVFSVVYYFTSRTAFYDWDDTKYYILMEDGLYVMKDMDGNVLEVTEEGYYVTALGTVMDIDEETGEFKVVAAVPTTGTETLQFSKYKGEFDILLYPMLERANIQSIEVHNEMYDVEKEEFFENSFRFVRDASGLFNIEGYEGLEFDSNMFATLVTVTGYTSTYARLDAEQVTLRGYAEYGLTDNPDDAKNYFIITDTSGNSHKVVLGDEIPAGTGYYARYVGRDDVYILKEMEVTDYSTTLSGALITRVESYVYPRVLAPMSGNNYFDVSNFMLNTVGEINEDILDDPDFNPETLLQNVITFSYSPIQIRQGTFYSNVAYTGAGAYEGYEVNNYKVDTCLQRLMSIEPVRCVELLSVQHNKDGLLYFATKYGVSYCLEFTHNTARDSKNNYTPTESMYQQLWFSPMTENGTYYLYNQLYSMVIEVNREDLEFLEWKAADWVDEDVFLGNIVFLDYLECFVPGGTTTGRTGLVKFSFDADNSESLVGWEPSSDSITLPSDKLKVWGNVPGEAPFTMDLAQFKNLYLSLLTSTMSGAAACSPEHAEAFREAAKNAEGDYQITHTCADENCPVTQYGAEPMLVLKMVFNNELDGSGSEIVRTYTFYRYSNRQCFVALNGKGSFYILQSRVEKLVRDLGLVFTPEVAIDPEAKT